MLINSGKNHYNSVIPTTNFGKNSYIQYNQIRPIQEDTVVIKGRFRKKRKKEDNFLKNIIILGGILAGGVLLYQYINKSCLNKTSNKNVAASNNEGILENGVLFASKLDKKDLPKEALEVSQKIQGSLPEYLQNKETKEQLRDSFKKLFHKNEIKDEDLDKMILSYYQILQNKKGDNFIKSMFYQVKKDFGYEDLDIFMKIKDVEYTKDGQKNLGRYMKISRAPDIDVEKHSSGIFISKANNITKDEYAETITHEFTHMYQDEIMFKTNPKEFKNNYMKRLLLENSTCSNIATEAEAEANRACILFKNYFGKEKIPNSNYAKKCFEWAGRDVNSDINEYKKSYLEEDARNAGKLMKNIVSLIFKE